MEPNGAKAAKCIWLVDTLGHLLSLHVTPANEQDRAQVSELAASVQEVTGHSVELAFVDQAYTGDAPAQSAQAHGKLSELSTYPQICQQVQALTEAGWTATAIAQALNEAGYCSARATARFGAQTVRELQRRLGVRALRPRIRPHDELLPDEWWPAELVRALQISRVSLYHWIRQGLVRARQLDNPLHRWVVWADEAEQERLRESHRRTIGDDLRHRWTDTPLAEQRE